MSMRKTHPYSTLVIVVCQHECTLVLYWLFMKPKMGTVKPKRQSHCGKDWRRVVIRDLWSAQTVWNPFLDINGWKHQLWGTFTFSWLWRHDNKVQILAFCDLNKATNQWVEGSAIQSRTMFAFSIMFYNAEHKVLNFTLEEIHNVVLWHLKGSINILDWWPFCAHFVEWDSPQLISLPPEVSAKYLNWNVKECTEVLAKWTR